MKKFVCTVCGYVYEGEAAPAECPICHAPADKFKEQTANGLENYIRIMRQRSPVLWENGRRLSREM